MTSDEMIPDDMAKEALFHAMVQRCMEMYKGIEKTMAENGIALPLNARAVFLGALVQLATERTVMAYKNALDPERNFRIEPLAEITIDDLEEWVRNNNLGGIYSEDEIKKMGMMGKRFNS